MTDDLRIIERTDGGPPIEASVEDRPDGTRILTHILPSGVKLETIIQSDGGLTVFADGKLQMDVGPPQLGVLVELGDADESPEEDQ